MEFVVAGGAYDRTVALRTGDARARGLDIRYLAMSPEEAFFRMLTNEEFPAAEMSLSSYVASLDRAGGSPFVAIPAFPSRSFRHRGIFVQSSSDHQRPSDLRGRCIGVPEYEMTAAVWIRGTLADRHDLPVGAVQYRTGGLTQPGRTAKSRISLPEGVDVSPIGPEETLEGLLLAGEIEAIYTARNPPLFDAADSPIRRLFSDVFDVERRYFEETGVFPIMHTVVLRRDVYEADRWIARSVLDAYSEAKRLALDALGDSVALSTSLPWGEQHRDETVQAMGPDYWPYGVEANRQVLTTFLTYAFDQGISGTQRTPDELFAPETLRTHVI